MEKKERQSKSFNEIWNIQSEMEVSQKRWDSIFHNWKEPWNCSGRKRPTGCEECDYIDKNGHDRNNNSFCISVIGDAHTNIEAIRQRASSNKLALLSVGDLSLYTTKSEAKSDSVCYKKEHKAIDLFLESIANKQLLPLEVPLYSILGNHDDFLNLKNEVFDNLGLTYLKNGSVLQIGNMTIATLGGIYSPKKFYWNNSKLEGYNKRFFTQEDIDLLLFNIKGKKVDILITHEAAHGILPEMKSGVDEGSYQLTQLLQKVNPKYYIHGHHHSEYTTTFNGIKVIGLGNFKLNQKTFVDFNVLTGEIINP